MSGHSLSPVALGCACFSGGCGPGIGASRWLVALGFPVSVSLCVGADPKTGIVFTSIPLGYVSQLARNMFRCSGILALCIRSIASAGHMVVCVVTDCCRSPVPRGDNSGGRGRVHTPPTIRCQSRHGNGGLAACYVRCFPFCPCTVFPSMELSATTVGEWRRRLSLRRHKAGTWIVAAAGSGLMWAKGKVVPVKTNKNQPHRGREQDLCNTSPRRGWVMRGGLCQDEQGPPQKTGEPSKNLEGAGPRNGGRRHQNRTGANPRTGSGALRSTFLTPAGSSRSWRSFLVAFDIVCCLSEIDFLNFVFVVSISPDDSTWVAVSDEMYIVQGHSTSEQYLSPVLERVHQLQKLQESFRTCHQEL